MASLWLLPNPLWQAMQRHFKYGQRTQQEWNVIIEDKKHEARKPEGVVLNEQRCGDLLR
jgi:hypothetical protein